MENTDMERAGLSLLHPDLANSVRQWAEQRALSLSQALSLLVGRGLLLSQDLEARANERNEKRRSP